MNTNNISINEIRKVGFKALITALGPVGTIRFLQQFDSGNGDYSKDRHDWIGEYNIDQIYDEIIKNR